MDINHREVPFVVFQSLELVLVQPGKPIIVAKGLIATLSTHLFQQLLVLLGKANFQILHRNTFKLSWFI
jgi:hypothetical protein